MGHFFLYLYVVCGSLDGSRCIRKPDCGIYGYEKLETQNAESSSQMEFVYDANDQLKRVTIKILAAGIETALNIEILSLRNSKEFPDKLFDI